MVLIHSNRVTIRKSVNNFLKHVWSITISAESNNDHLIALLFLWKVWWLAYQGSEFHSSCLLPPFVHTLLSNLWLPHRWRCKDFYCNSSPLPLLYKPPVSRVIPSHWETESAREDGSAFYFFIIEKTLVVSGFKPWPPVWQASALSILICS